MPPETPHLGRTTTDDLSTSEGSYGVAHTDSPTLVPMPGEAASSRDDVEEFADVIKQAGMVGPASVALRIAGPLSWIGGQMLWVVQPILQGFRVGSGKGNAVIGASDSSVISRLARFLEGEGNVTRLVAHLEAESAPKVTKNKGSRKSSGENNGPV